MGDFSDNTSLGSSAAIFLCREGLIESFPLSGSMRRWVVKTDHYIPNVHRKTIEERIHQRISHRLEGTQNTMLSSFRVEKKLATTMVKGRCLLAGDAAHIVSPIGGQGMNLGWLDAHELSIEFQQVFDAHKKPNTTLQRYSSHRLKMAQKALRRGELNMILGRKTSYPFFRKTILRLILNTPLSTWMARQFTMRGL